MSDGLRHAVVTTSQSLTSRSALLAEALALAAALDTPSDSVDLVDLRADVLPLYGRPDPQGAVPQVHRRLEQADTITLAVLVHNFTVGASATNLVAAGGRGRTWPSSASATVSCWTSEA